MAGRVLGSVDLEQSRNPTVQTVRAHDGHDYVIVLGYEQTTVQIMHAAGCKRCKRDEFGEQRPDF